MVSYYLQLAFERKTFIRAIRVAILVGIVLNLINNPSLFYSFFETQLNLGRVLLTFLVPFVVSTYSSVLSNSSLKPGSISHLDAILKCKSCNKTSFHVHIGEEVDECPACKKKTRWSPSKIFSFSHNDNELLKSLALFARYNPQPLFRINADGIILGANPAAESLFKTNEITGQNIAELLPEIGKSNFKQLVHTEGLNETLIHQEGRFYNLLMRGVPALHSIHVYGSDITEIVLAEQKIKRQSNAIKESIQYAWRIQKAMLTDDESIKQLFPEYFIFYRPRNIVSGDFYWANQVGSYKILAVADCTGHGVPGAFMSMMGMSLLNEIVLREQITNPALILNTLRERLIFALKAQSSNSDITDGMDISVVVFNEDGKLLFSGANNPLYLVRDGDLLVFKADPMPVGKDETDNRSFTDHEILIEPNDRIFLFTDGYKDQFGGDRDKKYSTRQFRELLTNTSALKINEQINVISESFDKWKGEHEQIDDVLVMGIEL